MRDRPEGRTPGAPRQRVWPPAAELAALLRRAQTDDSGALERLLALLRPAFVTLLARSLGPDDAEDATQVALRAITHALPRIDPDRALPYFFAVAGNVKRYGRRRRERDAKRFVSLGAASAVASAATPDDEVEYGDLVGAVRRWIEAAPPREHRGLVLGLLLGLRPHEIARRHGLRADSVRRWLQKSRDQLRLVLQPYTDLLCERRDEPQDSSHLVREEHAHPYLASAEATPRLAGRRPRRRRAEIAYARSTERLRLGGRAAPLVPTHCSLVRFRARVGRSVPVGHVFRHRALP